MLKKYYPSSENFLLNIVSEDDLYSYISNGFALVNVDGINCYVSFCYTKPMKAFKQTPELDEVFRQKNSGRSNISGLIKLFARFKVTQVHLGDTQKSWDKISKELKKEEHKETLENFKVTVENMIERMFPLYKL